MAQPKLKSTDTNPSPLPDSDPVGGMSAALDQVKVSVEAHIGHARLSIAEVSALKPDDILTLDASLSDPIELSINGNLVALGELVVVDDQFAIRIKSVGA